MTRDEFAWIVVRAIGAFLLLLIALDLIALTLTSIQAIVLRGDVMSATVDQDDVISQSIRYGRLVERAWYLGIEVLLKALLAYYCFFRGAWIKKLLSYNRSATEES